MFRITAAIGIDISSKYVRAALLEKKGNAFILKSLSSVAYQGADLEKALAHVKKMIIKTTRLPWFLISHQVFSIPLNRVVIKRFFAMREANEQEQFIQAGIQLSESLGLSLEELLYDYRQLKDTDGIEVFACRRSQIEDKLNALKTAGYRLSVIELQTFVLMRLFKHCLNHQSITGPSLLINIDKDHMQMCIYDDEKEQMQQAQPLTLHASHLVYEKEAITKQLAEYILLQYPLAAPHLNRKKITHIWLSGDNTEHVDVLSLAQKLEWEVRLLNPLVGLSYSPEIMDDLNEPLGAWSVAIGLALREIQ